jgi:hypothetical protein
MPKRSRRKYEVACVRVRARDTVRMREGSAAETWMGVSSFAREWSESNQWVNPGLENVRLCQCYVNARGSNEEKCIN